MPGNLSDLIDTVQKNCMIADARHARDDLGHLALRGSQRQLR